MCSFLLLVNSEGIPEGKRNEHSKGMPTAKERDAQNDAIYPPCILTPAVLCGHRFLVIKLNYIPNKDGPENPW